MQGLSFLRKNQCQRGRRSCGCTSVFIHEATMFRDGVSLFPASCSVDADCVISLLLLYILYLGSTCPALTLFGHQRVDLIREIDGTSHPSGASGGDDMAEKEFGKASSWLSLSTVSVSVVSYLVSFSLTVALSQAEVGRCPTPDRSSLSRSLPRYLRPLQYRTSAVSQA